jgi:hypothetical protein
MLLIDNDYAACSAVPHQLILARLLPYLPYSKVFPLTGILGILLKSCLFNSVLLWASISPASATPPRGLRSAKTDINACEYENAYQPHEAGGKGNM